MVHFNPMFIFTYLTETTSFVSAMYPHERGVGFPTFFCSWASKIRNDFLNLDFTVVEAVRATTAVPAFFKPARVGHVIPTSYFDIKLRSNNPTQYVIDMARELYGDRPISCLMSLGSGQTDVIGPCARLPGSTDTYRRWLPKKLLRALQDVITDCEQKSMDMRREIPRHLSSILYIRFNNDNTLGLLESLDEWRSVGINDHTTAYLVDAWRPGDLDRLLQALKGASAAILPISTTHKIVGTEMANSTASKDDHIPRKCSHEQPHQTSVD